MPDELWPTDEPRVRERTGGYAGCPAAFPKRIHSKLRKASEPADPKAVNPRIGFRPGQETRSGRLHLQLRTAALVRRDCEPMASLKSNCIKQERLLLLKNCVLPVDVLYLTGGVGCRGDVSFLSASPQYGEEPSLATANTLRNEGQILIAHSPDLQRVLVYWRFAMCLC
jgi:hypothetical protein